jgi:hypothetical protein
MGSRLAIKPVLSNAEVVTQANERRHFDFMVLFIVFVPAFFPAFFRRLCQKERATADT